LNRSNLVPSAVFALVVLIVGGVVVVGALEVTVYRGGRASSPSAKPCATAPAKPSARAPAPAPDRVVLTKSGTAIAPTRAPSRVERIVAAANEITGLPYRLGFGHMPYPKRGLPPCASAYDGSAADSFVLAAGGFLRQPLDDEQLARFGKPGPGRWVTIEVCNDGAHMTIGGVAFDAHGPGVMPLHPRLHWGNPAPTVWCVLRHPPYL
jgi:hypothetical protein